MKPIIQFDNEIITGAIIGRELIIGGRLVVGGELIVRVIDGGVDIISGGDIGVAVRGRVVEVGGGVAAGGGVMEVGSGVATGGGVVEVGEGYAVEEGVAIVGSIFGEAVLVKIN